MQNVEIEVVLRT